MFKLTLYLILFVNFISSVSCKCEFGMYEKGVNALEAAKIVYKHNHLRKQITHLKIKNQRKGLDFERLVWDIELALIAQNISNQCLYNHQEVSTDRWEWIGQNIGRSTHEKYEERPNWEKIIDSWFQEYVNYDYVKHNTSNADYTQSIWTKTEFIGCGYAHFHSAVKGPPFQKLYVCNYAPG